MKPLVIVNRGPAQQGKSSSVREVYNVLSKKYTRKVQVLRDDGDILGIVDVNGVLVGVESQGDPNSRMLETLNELVDNGCKIIVCASRTTGSTCNEVERITNLLDADLIWTTNPRTKTTSIIDYIHKKYAESIVSLVEERIASMY